MRTPQAPAPGWPVELFRIAFALVALRDVVQMLGHRDLFWDGGGWTQSPVVLGAWCAVLVLVALGVWTRAAAAVNLVLTVVVLHALAEEGMPETADATTILCALLVLVLPTGRGWTVHRRRCDHLVPATVPAVAAIVLATIYLDSGLRKLASPMWREGLGMWTASSLPEWIQHPIPGMDVELLAQLAGWGTIAWELSFGLVWFLAPRLRPLVWGAGFVFHLGGFVFFGFETFSLVMLCLHVLATPPAVAAAVSRPERETSWLPRRAVAAGVGVWLALHAVVLLDVGADPGSWRADAARFPQEHLGRYGVTNYGVFGDSLFSGQTFQLDVVWGAPGRCVAGPWHGPEGRERRWLRDRLWEHWTKRTQLWYTARPTAEANLARWIRYVEPAVPRGLRGQAVLLARPQTASTERFRPGLLDANSAAPWRPVGTVTSGAVRWAAPAPPTATHAAQVDAALAAGARVWPRERCGTAEPGFSLPL
jgi:hypothetical protein